MQFFSSVKFYKLVSKFYKGVKYFYSCIHRIGYRYRIRTIKPFGWIVLLNEWDIKLKKKQNVFFRVVKKNENCGIFFKKAFFVYIVTREIIYINLKTFTKITISSKNAFENRSMNSTSQKSTTKLSCLPVFFS